jgi:hypothetical protein
MKIVIHYRSDAVEPFTAKFYTDTGTMTHLETGGFTKIEDILDWAENNKGVKLELSREAKKILRLGGQ